MFKALPPHDRSIIMATLSAVVRAPSKIFKVHAFAMSDDALPLNPDAPVESQVLKAETFAGVRKTWLVPQICL